MISYETISFPKTDIFYIWSHEATIFSATIRYAYNLQLQLIFIFPVDSTSYKSVTSSSIFDKVRLILQRCLKAHTFLMYEYNLKAKDFVQGFLHLILISLRLVAFYLLKSHPLIATDERFVVQDKSSFGGYWTRCF